MISFERYVFLSRIWFPLQERMSFAGCHSLRNYDVSYIIWCPLQCRVYIIWCPLHNMIFLHRPWFPGQRMISAHYRNNLANYFWASLPLRQVISDFRTVFISDISVFFTVFWCSKAFHQNPFGRLTRRYRDIFSPEINVVYNIYRLRAYCFVSLHFFWDLRNPVSLHQFFWLSFPACPFLSIFNLSFSIHFLCFTFLICFSTFLFYASIDLDLF